jgi:hypothetical protein
MSTLTGNGADPDRARGTGPASPRRERMLSELAAEIRAARADERRDVAQLQAELGRIAGLLGENADLLAQTLPRVTALDADLAGLAARVDDLTAATPTAGVAGVDWPALSADAAAAEWDALATWIADVLGPFYQLTRAQLPDCWALHPPAVIELVWLRRAYVAAHAPDAAPAAAGEWHTRWRRDALTNIAAAIPTTWCRPGEHYLKRLRLRAAVDPVNARTSSSATRRIVGRLGNATVQVSTCGARRASTTAGSSADSGAGAAAGSRSRSSAASTA